MATFVFPQPVGRPPYISGPTNRNIIFVEYRHTVTALEKGYLELWLPFVNGQSEPHHAMIHMATLELSKDIGKPNIVRAFMQSPDETVRTLLHQGDGKAGVENQRCPFIAVYGSRAVIVLNSAPQGLTAVISYQLELI